MEKILHQILINIYDWRMWVVLICIPLLFAGSIYSCIQKRHDWRRKEIVLNMVPIWVFLLGGGLVFAHVLDLVDFCANVIGGILMGVVVRVFYRFMFLKVFYFCGGFAGYSVDPRNFPANPRNSSSS